MIISVIFYLRLPGYHYLLAKHILSEYEVQTGLAPSIVPTVVATASSVSDEPMGV